MLKKRLLLMNQFGQSALEKQLLPKMQMKYVEQFVRQLDELYGEEVADSCSHPIRWKC